MLEGGWVVVQAESRIESIELCSVFSLWLVSWADILWKVCFFLRFRGFCRCVNSACDAVLVPCWLLGFVLDLFEILYLRGPPVD